MAEGGQDSQNTPKTEVTDMASSCEEDVAMQRLIEKMKRYVCK